MPCRCDDYEQPKLNHELSKVCCLLQEIDHGNFDVYDYWGGTHPTVYNRNISNDKADDLTSELCAKIQKIEKESELSNYSLELQIWWRDHKKQDKLRIQEELDKKYEEDAKERALRKLSAYEKKLLGLSLLLLVCFFVAGCITRTPYNIEHSYTIEAIAPDGTIAQTLNIKSVEYPEVEYHKYKTRLHWKESSQDLKTVCHFPKYLFIKITTNGEAHDTSAE